MSQKALTYLFMVVVALGLADALYLSMTVFLGIAPTCGIFEGCQTVTSSSYSRIFFGIHMSYLAAAYFTGAAILGGFLDSRLGQKLTVAYAGFGVIIALYSLFLMASVLHAWCIYCIGIDVALFLTFILSIAILRRGDERGTLAATA